jgi:membrane protease YdiL (CAAX protease family)
MPEQYFRRRHSDIYYAALVSLGFWVFAVFIHWSFPMKWVAISAIVFCIFLIVLKIDSIQSLLLQFRLRKSINPLKFISIGLAVGLLLAILDRLSIRMTPIPSSLSWFALVAAAIGSTEELIFRGFILTHTAKKNVLFGVVFAAASHSIYKCCLFLFPDPAYDYPMIYLFLLTFGVGLLAGWITVKSKSIYPALLGHAMFDIVLYGELTQAPWWVF